MILALSISATVFLLTLWRRDYGIATIVLLWPAYLLRTTIAGIPTTALELSIYALVLGWLVMYKQTAIAPPVRLPRNVLILLGAWSLAWILATVFSQDRQASLGAFKAWLVDPLLFSWITLSTIQTVKQRTLVLSAAALSGSIVAIGGLAQLVWFRDTVQDGRLSSFFYPVANYAAMFLGPLLLITVGAVLWKYIHRVWLAAVILMTVAIALTVSFGGYLAVGVGALMMWWRWPNQKTKRRVLVIGIITIVLGAIGLSQTQYLAEKLQTTDRSSSLVRTQIWRTSWQMIVEHPVVGIGPNAFEPIYRATIPKLYWPPLEWLVSQPHQLYLALWLETGLLGLLAFLGLIGYWFRRAWLQYLSGSGMALIAVSAMVAILAHGFVDTPYFKNDLALVFMFIVLLPFLRIEDEKNKFRTSSKNKLTH